MRLRLEHRENNEGRLARLASCLCCALLVATCALGMSKAALADQGGTLTLTMAYSSGGKTTNISGVTATAYCVADLDDPVNHYTLRDDFVSLDVNFDEGVADAATMEALAQQAVKLLPPNAKGVSATSGSDGKAAFGTLPNGLYLVIQTGAKGDAENYSDFTPFLISVPQITTEGVVWDVEALPKLAPKPPTPSPQTGDEANPQLWITCSIVGGALIALGAYGLHRLGREDVAEA